MIKVAIIGGGAAGLMAAVAALETNPGARVTLFEKNKILGAKILISGGGRCNITTGILDVHEVLKNYPRGRRFLTKALFRFPPQAVIDWFGVHGVPTKTEPDGRVFPVAEIGNVVIDALRGAITACEGEIRVATPVRAVKHQGATFVVVTDSNVFEFDAVILATGGTAYRQTGSTGDGYAFAAALGHTITELAPSLNSFLVAEKWVSDCAGVSLQEVRLRFRSGQRIYERTGPLVFTHAGISGPAVFALSSVAAYERYSLQDPISLYIDLCPRVANGRLETRLSELIALHPRKNLKNLLDMLLPASLAAAIAKHIPFKKNVVELPREKRAQVSLLLKEVQLHVTGRGAGDEFVTAGGVDLREVDPNTMQSRICPNLYIAGELLNVDGFTGGFNLQAAWATGRLAGETAAGARLAPTK